jgi:alpha-L-rhamnosidase
MSINPVTVQKLQTEALENPLGIDARNPRFSWQIVSTELATVQRAYQIQVAENPADFVQGMFLLWNSGKLTSDCTTGVSYQGPDLKSGKRYYWRVRVWDQAHHQSAWSETAWWEMGLLDESEWKAGWIEPDWEEDPKAYNPSPFLRRSFDLAQPVKSARLYVTAHGLYEAWLNGQRVSDRVSGRVGGRVGDQVFTPGFTAYDLRLQYQVYDVTALLQPGENVLGAILGDGWYRGEIYITGERNVYGSRLGLLAQLKLELADGSELTIASDANWKAATGPILSADMKAGETYDARLELPGWSASGFDDSAWKGVRVAAHPKNHLVASTSVPVRLKETFQAVAVLKTPNGETVLDFGQNLAGVVHMQVQGPAGTTITLQHGEALDKDGNFTMENIAEGQKARFQQDRYTLQGNGAVEEYQPRFTVHGFRYVKVDGYPGEIRPENFHSVAIYSDMTPTGTFTCSDPLINRLHQNVVWSMKSNFLDIPTDCPQRERAGWVGDAQIFAPSAAFLMDTRAFFRKWLTDLRLEQRPDGLLGNFVPNPHKLVKGSLSTFARLIDGSAGWADAAVILPWEQYWAFGDRQILEDQYASMKAWVDWGEKKAHKTNLATALNPRYTFSRAYRRRVKRLWDTGYHWGEWLEPGDELLGGGMVRSLLKRVLHNQIYGCAVVSAAYFAHSADLLAQTAALLGKAEDAQKYRALADEVKAAYAATIMGPDGRIEPDRQASYVRVLAFDLAPQELKPAIVEHLVRLIRAAGNHIGTGFLSTVFLCQVLAENGHLDVAYELLNQKTSPSWLYAVTRGATTIWEKWDGIRTDGTPSASLNHYSPGAVIDFLHRKVAGIEAAEPGYSLVTIHPMPGGGLTSASATYESVHGPIRSAWEISDGRMSLDVMLPANTRAVVILPGAALDTVMEGSMLISLVKPEGITASAQVGADSRFEIGSGSYHFDYPLN